MESVAAVESLWRGGGNNSNDNDDDDKTAKENTEFKKEKETDYTINEVQNCSFSPAAR